MGTSERVVLNSMPWQVVAGFATLWSLLGLGWLLGAMDGGPSTLGVALGVSFLLLAGGYFAFSRVKVVVSVAGVTCRALVRDRLVPWDEIRKVDQVNRFGVRYVRFWTSKRVVEAAGPSEEDYQRIMTMRGGHRSGSKPRSCLGELN